ncbi:MAG: hypothetical protein J7639_01035 [Paenibacillaceae bacterium]|nr:hypothetical protein [Paenibacillaceae bacterium]
MSFDKKRSWRRLLSGLLLATMLAAPLGIAAVQPAQAATGELVVYDDALSAEFADYGWAQHNLAETGIVHSGSQAIRFDPDEGQALYFYKDRIMNAADYGSLRFWINGGAGHGQQFTLVLTLGGQAVAEIPSGALLPAGGVAGAWQQVDVPLADYGATGLLDGILIWGAVDQEPLYLDDIAFTGRAPGQSPTPGPTASPSPSAGPTAKPSASPSSSPAPGDPIEPVEGLYVFDDALADSFTDYSWAQHSLEESETVHTGSRSIRFQPNGDAALYLYSDRIVLTKEYDRLKLWVNGGASGGQQVKLVFLSGGQAVVEHSLNDWLPEGIPAEQWALVDIALADLQLPGQLFDGIMLAGTVPGEQAALYVDDMALMAKQVAQAAVVEVRMDKNRFVMLPGEHQTLQSETFLASGDTGIVTEQAEWSTDRPDVLQVEKGSLTALAPGIAKVTATYKGLHAEAYVQVTDVISEPVYADELEEGYRNLSWHDKDFANSEQTHSGTRSIKFEPDGWDGVWIASATEKALADYYGVRLRLFGGATGGQKLLFHIYEGGTSLGAIDVNRYLPEGGLLPGKWTEITVNMADVGLETGSFDGFILQAATEGNQDAVYIDDIELLRNPNPGQLPEPELPVIGVTVDTEAARKPISNNIYGINYDESHPTDSKLPFPVQRWGGNQTTRYNWELDVANRASDWYFMNYPYETDHPEQLPNGSMADRFIDMVRGDGSNGGAGGNVLLTVPTIGWTPKDRVVHYGFSQQKYGTQTSGAPELRDAGSGVFPGGSLVTGNDPYDTSKPIGPDFVTRWMDHIAQQTAGGVHMYALDNEPEIWHVTHRDVHPNAPTYDELWNKTVQYGTAIKQKDPAAQLFGPVSWGWCAYFYSSADNCADGPDRQAHEGMPFLAWYLKQAQAYEEQTGIRLIDYLDIHYYSQEDGVPSTDESPATAKRRFQALKSLYDDNFVDQSWIQEPIRLIPRMKETIAEQLPGVKLAITEYNFGNGDGITAGLAQAEALAIFGREGVDLATRFGNFQAGTPIEDAFKLFLNYDGNGSKIEGSSVPTSSTLSDAVGSYTIAGNDGKQYVLLFNKDTVTRAVNVNTGSAGDTSAVVYRFDANTRLAAAGTVASSDDGTIALRLPKRSATLLVIP